MVSFFGWLGAALFSVASVPQVWKVLRSGHADGLSWGYLLLVWFGFWSMGIYALQTHSGRVLLFSYAAQLVAFTILILVKRFPYKRGGITLRKWRARREFALQALRRPAKPTRT
jgi:uncharacterized protein with PQ loop repeat